MWNIKMSSKFFMKYARSYNSLAGTRWRSGLTKSISGFVLLLIFSQAVQAQIYKCENDAGEIIFSDEPCAKNEASTRLKWLKNTPASKKKPISSNRGSSSRAKQTAKKARKNNQAYVLLSLLTTTQLELETATVRSSLDENTTDAPELLLPDGITIDLLTVDKILLAPARGKGGLQVQFIMDDGYEEIKIINQPYPVISGEAKIGRFSKSLADIKRIEFFNSKKLLKLRGDKRAHKKNKKTTTGKKTIESRGKAEETPVIELDLSHEVMAGEKSTGQITAPVKTYDGQSEINRAKPAVKVVADKNLQVKKLSPEYRQKAKKNTGTKKLSFSTVAKAQVNFVNDTKSWLLKSSLGSSRSSQKADGQSFILNNREHIPYDKIKSIRVRPTADRSKLVVAVALKSGEIKMENMSKPFTRIVGRTASGTFNHSLLEIKSISFQH